MSHVPNCTKSMKTYQGYLVCKSNVISVTVPNVASVPNVTSAPNVPKMPKNHSCVLKMYQKATCCTYWCSVSTGVPNVTCTKITKTYQGLCLACKNSITSVTVPNVTGVPNVTSTQNVPKMTRNHSSVLKLSQTGTRCTNSVY